MIYAFGDCELDTQRMTLLRAGETTRVRPKVFQLLSYLLTHRDRVLTKQELCEQLWPEQFISDATLSSTVRSARRAIGDLRGEQQFIQTQHGQGYRFVGSVTERSESSEGLASTIVDVHATPKPETAEAPPPSSVPVATSHAWRCLACDHVNPVGPPDAKFCMACGAPFSLHCSQCRVQTLPDAKFCASCGASLTATPLTAPTASQMTSPIPDTTPLLVTETMSSAPMPERRQLTVMSCNLANATELAAQLDLEDYRHVIRLYQQQCTDVIRQYDGYIAQFLSDGLLVYFGYPLAHEDDARRATHTGLNIVNTVKTLNARLETEQGVTLSVKIGVHTGIVIVDHIGDDTDRDQLTLGDTPKIATGLQNLAEADTVVTSTATAHLIRGHFTCQEIGIHTLKGRTAPEPLIRVLNASGAQSHLGASGTHELTPMVNRTTETRLLFDHWERVQEGFGHVILLSGEPGIGKSRLTENFKLQLPTSSYIYLECRCSPYHQNSVWYAVIEMCQRFLQWQPDDASELKLQKLEAVLIQYALSTADMVPLFAAFLSLPLDESLYPPRPLAPQQQRQLIMQALLEFILALSDRQPVLLMVEDLHWIDPSTLEFLSLVVKQTPETSLCIILSYRPEFEPPWGHRSYMTYLNLTRMPQRYVEELVTHVAGGKILPDDVMRQVVGRTDGVPMFIEECTKSILETGLLHLTHDQYELVAPLPTLAIPSTLHDSLTARLDRLGATKGVAQLAATVGRRIPYELLRHVWQGDEGLLQDGLERLVAGEFLHPQGRSPRTAYVFKHALIQETSYQSLLRDTRQRYHERIAQALAEYFPALVEAEPEFLAHHYSEAGLIEEAIPCWQRAGERAIERSANREAVHHLNRGLELLLTLPESLERHERELSLQLALGSCLNALQGTASPEVGQAYTRAYELSPQVGDNSKFFLALWGLVFFYFTKGEFRTSWELGAQCMQIAEDVQDTVLLQETHQVLGANLFFMGNPKLAHEHLEQSIALYDPQRCEGRKYILGVDPGVMSLTRAACSLWMLGYPQRAIDRVNEALALAQTSSHAHSLAFALHHSAMVHQCRREVALVRERAERLIAHSEEHNLAYWRAGGMLFQGWSMAMTDTSEEGIASIRQGLDAWRALDAHLGQTYVLARLAEAYQRSGQVSEGLRALAEALEAVDIRDERHYEPELYRLQGELLLQREDAFAVSSAPPEWLVEAETCFHQALDLSRQRQAKSMELRAAMSLSRFWQRTGQQTVAHQLLSEIVDWFTEGFETLDMQEANALLHGRA